MYALLLGVMAVVVIVYLKGRDNRSGDPTDEGDGGPSRPSMKSASHSSDSESQDFEFDDKHKHFSARADTSDAFGVWYSFGRIIARHVLPVLSMSVLSRFAGRYVAVLWVLPLLHRTYVDFKKRGYDEDTFNRDNGTEGWRNGVPPRSDSMMRVDEALLILGLDRTATKRDINAAYRQKMKIDHPDQGGREEAAAVLNLARDTLISHLSAGYHRK